MRRAPLFCLLLAAPAAAFAPPWPADPDAHITAENTLVFDRWQGSRVDPVERIFVRQRLALTWFAKRRPRARDWGADVGLDLRIDADLSPSADAQARLPNGRRPAIDARRAALRFQNIAGAVDAEVGRHLVADALGLTLYDGGTVGLRAPYIGLGFSAGLGSAPGWSEFGPSIFAPDGTRYDDALAWVIGGRAQTLDLPWLDVNLALRQRRGRGEIQESLAGAAADVRWGGAGLGARTTADLVYNRAETVEVAARWRGALDAGLGWRRFWPTYRADSIWNAFGSHPHHTLFSHLAVPVERLRFEVDLAVRTLVSGGALRSAEGDAIDPEDERTIELGARASWRPVMGGELGVAGRYADGYGGERHYVDLFVRERVDSWRPFDVEARLGGVRVTPVRGADPVLSGWALLGVDWPIAQTITLLVQTEAYSHADAPFRMRAMTHVRFEDWW